MPRRSMHDPKPWLAVPVRSLARVLLGVYFRRIEYYHAERVPNTGPLILAPNHPASVTDALVLAAALRRRVYFVGTVQLFRCKPLGALLRRCGIIPINRLKDDPRAMRTVLDTFEACYRVLEQGGALGIFPEGVTYDDTRLRPVKSGVARIALELEQRHEGRLGLVIVPVGLSYAAKERYRSELLVHFGEPLTVAGRSGGGNRKEAIQELTATLEARLQALLVHLPTLELARVVEGVKRLYLDRLVVARRLIGAPLAPQAEALVLTQAISSAVAFFAQHRPDRFGEFVRRLDAYDARLRRLRLSDEAVRVFGGERGWGARVALWSWLALIGLPVAVYGWAHRLLPSLLVEWAVKRFTSDATPKAQTPIATMLTGLVAFVLCYAVYIAVVHRWVGWPASFYYALSLPLTGLFAHQYARQGSRLLEATRAFGILLRAPWVRRGLLRQRQRLVEALEAGRRDYRDQRLAAAARRRPDVGPQTATKESAAGEQSTGGGQTS